MCRRHLTSL
ncbi:hypothetical protein F383_16581 [Gossypium arboreum]|uniref:Uncharacterized protein n=1 Tax=Gossypium arboreum TaxID=29729 RepID=A0A0B0MLE4_GOSAR|nr:hypothetical protein F383_39281 [Gossypium arboreum]KHG15270.1 hypothetical protein F383_16581 [Gossypium arboreum]